MHYDFLHEGFYLDSQAIGFGRKLVTFFTDYTALNIITLVWNF